MSRRVLVTGAASGLGLALAQGFAAAGDRVLLTDRDEHGLRAALDGLGGGDLGDGGPVGAVHGLLHDVREDADWVAARVWCSEHWGGLDVLVNNAGVATGGRITHQPIEDWEWVTSINLLGVVRGCHTFVPLMQRQGSGHLVNVASLAGLVNPPGMASYNVVKAGVISLSETLRLELEPDGIAVTVVCPSFFRTGLTSSIRTGDPGTRALMAKLVDGSSTPASAIAAQVLRAVERRRFLVLTDRDGRTSHLVKRWLPPLFLRVARKRTATLLGALAAAERRAVAAREEDR